MIFISAPLYGDGNTGNCESLKKEYQIKIDKFNSVKNKMSKPDISKDEYDQLYADYTELWSEASQVKKKIQECEQNAKSKHLALFNEGIALKKDKKYAEALAKFLEVTKIKSDFQKVNYQIVDVLIYLGRDGEIDKWLDQVNDAEEKGKLLYKRATAVKNTDSKKSIKYYAEMAKYYKPAKAYYLAGMVYLNKLYNKEKAVVNFKAALKYTPEDPKLYDAIGATIMELKPPKGKTKKDLTTEAIVYFKNGIKYGEGYKYLDVLCVRLAQAYNSIDQNKNAIKYADMAIKNTKSKNLASANLEKGIALCKMDSCSEAKKYLLLANKDITTKSQATFWLDKANEAAEGSE